MVAYIAVFIAYYRSKGARLVIESLLIAGVIVFGMYFLFEKLLNMTLLSKTTLFDRCSRNWQGR